MFNFSPCVLENRSDLDFHFEVLVLPVFGQLFATISDFHYVMHRQITELIVTQDHRFIARIVGVYVKFTLNNVRNPLNIVLKVSYNPQARNIRDVCQFSVFLTPLN